MPLGTTPSIDLAIERGADFYIPFEIEASLLNALGVADISGWTFLMTIRDEDDSGSAIYQTINGSVTDAVLRTGQFHVTDTVNEALPVGTYLHDMWRVDNDFEFCLGKGNYVVQTNRRVP